MAEEGYLSFSKYRIYLSDGSSDLEVLEYELFDTPITFKWMATVVNAYERKLPIAGLSINVRPTAQHLRLIIEEMETLIRQVNSEGIVRLRSSVALDQHSLNRLHEEFHSHEETFIEKGVESPTRSALQKLNTAIHRLENVMGNLRGDPNFYLQSLLFHYKGQRRVLLEAKDYEYFNEESCFGDLVVGYGTTGKSLLQCYQSRDVELLRKRMARPQMDVSTEVVAMFPSADPMEGAASEETERMLAWLREQPDIAGLYDLEDRSLIFCHAPKIGVLTGEYSNVDIFELLSLYPQVAKTELLS